MWEYIALHVKRDSVDVIEVKDHEIGRGLCKWAFEKHRVPEMGGVPERMQQKWEAVTASSDRDYQVKSVVSLDARRGREIVFLKSPGCTQPSGQLNFSPVPGSSDLYHRTVLEMNLCDMLKKPQDTGSSL